MALCAGLLAASAPLPMHGAGRPVAPAAASDLRARQLAADVREFAQAPGLSRSKREKRIATAVRTAVVAATAYRQDEGGRLGTAAELAAAAARAAPAYADVIASAAALAPGVVRLEGAAGTIRAAVAAGARGTGKKGPARSARQATARTGRPAPRAPDATEQEEFAEHAPSPRRPRAAAPSDEESFPGEDPGVAAAPARRGTGDQSVAFSLTTDITARYDDNVYLAKENKTHDTIVSATPGVSVRWGQNARVSGEAAVSETFNHYTEKTSRNVALPQARLNAAYQGAASAASVAASYQQLYQANADVDPAQRNDRIKTSLTAASGSVEASPLVKTGFRTGASYSQVKYGAPGLVGNRQVGIPFDVLFHATPKTDFSLGYTWSQQTPDRGDARGKDGYLNIGARGEFTAKLSGNVSAGYRMRRIAGFPGERMVGFDGSLNYALTPKTTMTLGMSRDFNFSAVGSSTRNTSFRLGIDAEVSPQWRFGARLGHMNNRYGANVVGSDPANTTARTDRVWEGELNATYLFNDWLSASFAYFLRRNQSTRDALDYGSNVGAITVGLRY